MGKCIALCGFMGCGKSTIGKRLARELSLEFCDLDRYIEEQEGRTVTEMFQKFGETGFRARERQAVRELSKREEIVIACGGGTVLFPENVEEFHKNGAKILYLKVPLPFLQERLKNDRKRPLLQRTDRREFIERLYRERCPLYEKAADQVIEARVSKAAVVRKILELYPDLSL